MCWHSEDQMIEVLCCLAQLDLPSIFLSLDGLDTARRAQCLSRHLPDNRFHHALHTVAHGSKQRLWGHRRGMLCCSGRKGATDKAAMPAFHVDHERQGRPCAKHRCVSAVDAGQHWISQAIHYLRVEMPRDETGNAFIIIRAEWLRWPEIFACHCQLRLAGKQTRGQDRTNPCGHHHLHSWRNRLQTAIDQDAGLAILIATTDEL